MLDNLDEQKPERRARLKEPAAEQTATSAKVKRTPEDPRDHPEYQKFRGQILESNQNDNLSILESARAYRGLLRFLEQTYSKYRNLGRIVDEDFGETLQTMRRKVRYLEGYEKAVDAGKGDIMLQINATVFYIVLAPSVPETAFVEVMRKAERGDKLTVEIAQNIVDRHRGNGGAGGGGRGTGGSRKSANATGRSTKSAKEFKKLRVDSQTSQLRKALWDLDAKIKVADPKALDRFRDFAQENPDAFDHVRKLLAAPETEAAESSATKAGADA